LQKNSIKEEDAKDVGLSGEKEFNPGGEKRNL